MKRKLLFAVMTLITGAWSLSANAQQQDVTATYLTNADFSSGTVIDNGICTYGKDMADNNTTYYGAQAIDGWTNASVGVEADGYAGCAIAGGLFAYGGTPFLGGAGYTAPTGTGNAAGLIAVWGNTIRYTQDVTLEAGSYTIVYKVYNATSGGGNSSGIITSNLFGFAENGGTTHYAPNNTFALGQWSSVAVTFNLSAQTAGKISMGYVGPGGSGAMPHLFVDNVKILKNAFYTDKTSAVNATGWSGVNDNYQGGTINTARNYNTLTAQRILYQTVNGLDNGTYEVVLYSISQKEWNGALANDAGNVAYVFAEGLTEQREWMNARARNSYPGDENVGIYTISGVKVSDGKLTLGMGTAQANQTQWHHIQIKSLIYTNGIDLSDYAEALQLAVDAANDLNGKIPTAGYNAVDAVVTANNQVYTTPENYQAATAAINQAIATYGTEAIKNAYAEYKAAVAQATQFTTVTVTADTEAQRVTNKAAFDTTMGNISATVEAVTTNASTITAQLAAIKQAGIDYITGLAPADTSNDFDVTFLITNPNFDSNTNGWTTNTGAQNVGIATNNPFPNPPMWENWKGSGFTGKMYQTITGLPAGKYEFTMYAFVNNLDTNNQYLYANDSKANITQSEPKQYVISDIAVMDGTLEIGLALTSTTANWVQIDQATLKYVGPFADLTPYIDAWLAALAAARETAATNEKMANWVLTNLNTVISENDETQVDQTSQAALEAATAALIAANELGQKSIHSYAVIAQGFVPDNSLEGWTCETFVAGQDVRFQVNTWSTEGNSDGSNMRTPFIENWTPGGNLLGAGKVYYRLEGLEPGEVYRVEALVRSYNEASADAPNGPNFYVNDDVADLTEVGTTFTYNNMSGIYGTQIAAATIGADGVLELGVVVASNRNYNWVAFKNIQISTFDAALEAAIARVEALEGKVPAGPYADAYAVVTANTGENYPTTAEQFETAIEALNQAADDLEPMVEAFSKFLELKAIAEFNRDAESDADEADAQDYAGQITAAQAAVDAATSVVDVEAANAQLKANMTTYVNNNNPVGDGKFNMTFLLTNPNLEGLPIWTGCEGWASEQTDGNKQVMTNDEATSEDGTKTAFYEYWSDPAKTNGLFNLYTSITLPAGTYQMSCYAFAKDQYQGVYGAGIYFYANDTQGSQVTSDRLSAQSVEFVNTEEQLVKIGLKSTEDNTYNWMGIGYVELYKIPAQAFAVGGDAWDPATEGAGDVTIDRTINVGYNAYILPFNMTQAEVEAAFGEGSTVKVVRAFDADNEILKFSTRQGIAANEPCLVKATAAAAAGEVVIPNRTLVPAAASEIVSEGEGLTMTGCYADETDVPLYSLFVQNAQLIYNESSAYIYSTRTYITLEGWTPGENGIKGLTIIDDDEATGIAVVENGQLNLLTGKVYDLSGRAVKNPTKGLYIIDGKKVMLK